MFPTDAKTWILYIVLTVILGAIGSGFWESVFRPIFSKLGRVSLRILTLGLSSALNSIYGDIAKRQVHRPILFLTFLITISAAGFLGMTGSYYHAKSLGGEEQTRAEAESTFNEGGISGLDSRRKELEEKLSLLLFLFSIYFFVFTLYAYLRNSYVVSAIGYFDQCSAICLPYMTDDARKHLTSKFAQIKTKADFQEVIGHLHEVAEKNNLRLPSFSLF